MDVFNDIQRANYDEEAKVMFNNVIQELEGRKENLIKELHFLNQELSLTRNELNKIEKLETEGEI